MEGICRCASGGLIAAAPHFLLQQCPAQANQGAGPRRQKHPSRIIASGIPGGIECVERAILATSDAWVLPTSVSPRGGAST